MLGGSQFRDAGIAPVASILQCLMVQQVTSRDHASGCIRVALEWHNVVRRIGSMTPTRQAKRRDAPDDKWLYLALREIADWPLPAYQPIGPSAGPGECLGNGVSDVAIGTRYEDCPLRHDLTLCRSRFPLTGRQLSDMLARIAAGTPASPFDTTAEVRWPGPVFPPQGRRTAISISTFNSGV